MQAGVILGAWLSDDSFRVYSTYDPDWNLHGWDVWRPMVKPTTPGNYRESMFLIYAEKPL